MAIIKTSFTLRLNLIDHAKIKGNTAQLPNEQKYDIIDIWKDK